MDKEEKFHKIGVVFLVTAPLVATLAGVLLLWNRAVSFHDLLLFFVFYVLTAFGITVGYHRMLTHRGFEAPQWVRALFLILGSMALEGPADRWAATHIKHHAHSDQEGDPHSPLQGFWHAHMGWLFNVKNFAEVAEYAPHLLQDPVVRWVSYWTPLWMVLSFLLPFWLGGWTGLLWGGFVRIFLVTHVTWSVNSICHYFGRHPFVTTDGSRNHWLVGLLAFGEGWHNNHHAFPNSASHGLWWWQFDASGLLIRAMERVGLVWKVQQPSRQVILNSLAGVAGAREAFMELREQLFLHLTGARETLQGFFHGVSDPGLEEICRDAMCRLDEIHSYLSRIQYMKRQQILAYQVEIQELVKQAQKARFAVPATPVV